MVGDGSRFGVARRVGVADGATLGVIVRVGVIVTAGATVGVTVRVAAGATVGVTVRVGVSVAVGCAGITVGATTGRIPAGKTTFTSPPLKLSTLEFIGSDKPIRPPPVPCVQAPGPLVGIVTLPTSVVVLPAVLYTFTIPFASATALNVLPEAKVAAKVARVVRVPPPFVVVATLT